MHSVDKLPQKVSFFATFFQFTDFRGHLRPQSLRGPSWQFKANGGHLRLFKANDNI